ncbi:MAG: hypothetical protein ACK4NC_02590 [Candidatus Gracilibacteria bacterium]
MGQTDIKSELEKEIERKEREVFSKVQTGDEIVTLLLLTHTKEGLKSALRNYHADTKVLIAALEHKECEAEDVLVIIANHSCVSYLKILIGISERLMNIFQRYDEYFKKKEIELLEKSESTLNIFDERTKKFKVGLEIAELIVEKSIYNNEVIKNLSKSPYVGDRIKIIK